MFQEWELVSSDKVKEIGEAIIALCEFHGWTPASLLITCKEMSRFLEAHGVEVAEDPPQNRLN